MELEQEFKEIIKKNLPAHVGDVLKERLAQAEQDKKDLESYKEKDRVSMEMIQSLNIYLNSYKEFDIRNALLETREKEITNRETLQRIAELEYQILAEKEKTEFTKSVALGLVRNTSYRKNIFDTENPGGMPIVDGQGYAHYPMSTSKHYNETREED